MDLTQIRQLTQSDSIILMLYSSFRLDSSEKWQIITVSKCDETISHSEKAHFSYHHHHIAVSVVVIYSMCVCLSTSEARSAEEDVSRISHFLSHFFSTPKSVYELDLGLGGHLFFTFVFTIDWVI